jgi:glycosyltransferase involved in cell wall biosynthesis
LNLPAVIFVLTQTNAAADGGISSISQVIAGLRRHRPIIVTDRESDRLDRWRSEGIEVHVVPQTVSRRVSDNPNGAIRSYWRYAYTVGRLIRSSGAKVVHANDPAAAQLAIAPAKLARAKLVFNLRGTFDPEHPPSRLKYWLLFAIADHILYLSHDMARRWLRHVPNAASSFSVTYSPVDLDRFRPAAFDHGQPIVLVSGLIRPLKGQLEFIRNVVPKLAGHAKVWFAGDFEPGVDPYMASCAEAAAPLGDSAKFLGYRTDIAELVGRSRVVAIPSRHEGLVRAMIEAMSSARPVVSFDISSARELLEDQSEGAGKVVEAGDYDGMAEAILAYCRDPVLAATAGEKGRSAALRLCSSEEVIARYERVYEMLGGGPA